ncbi:hypothetical protein N9145_00510 [bacterium]|nr:hypothetical protein [bacterium]
MNSYDQDNINEIKHIVGAYINHKYKDEDYLKFIKGVDIDGLLNESPDIKDHKDDSLEFHQETYDETSSKSKQWWAKKMEDFFNNS